MSRSSRALDRLRTGGQALVTTARNGALLRAQASFAAGWTSEWALVVAVGVFAFREGGPVQVSVIAALRMAVPALAAPVLTVAADRLRRDRVLLWAGLARGAAVAGAAALMASGGSIPVIYALLVIAACAFILTRAANSALVPLLCRSPIDLTAAMASRGLLDSLSTLVGPLLAAAVLATSTPAVVLGVVAALSFASGLLLVPIEYESAPRAVASRALQGFLADTAGGLTALAGNRDAAVLAALALVQTFIRGCLNVLLVILAFDVLGAGQVGVGILTGAVGLGATVASIGVFAFISSRHLALVEGIGVALWGLPLVLTGAIRPDAGLVGLMALIGVGNAMVDVGLFTLLARLVPERVLARAFGTFESLVALTVALGALVTPIAVSRLGLTAALAVIGALSPAAVGIAWWRLLRIDRSIVHRDAEIGVLRKVRLLEVLPLPVVEDLAAHLGYERARPGTEVIRQGDAGDTFYVIAAGSALVVRDGHEIARLNVGDCFGEIALLRSTVRTATVRAETDLDVYTLNRHEFLGALRGCSAGDVAAQSLVRDRVAMFARPERALDN